MSLKSCCIGLFACLSFGIIGCEQISGTQADLIKAAIHGDLKEFRSLFTAKAQDTRFFGSQLSLSVKNS